MSLDPIPDPYLALGLAKDATSQQIKATYRKLALKYHPDKVTDASLKASAADNFHRIQQAYEVVGDDGKRSKYDASIRLAELQKAYQKEKEVSDRYRSATQPVRADVRTAAYEVPTAARGAGSYPTRASETYQTFRPRAAYDSDYFDDPPVSKPTGRKYSSVDADAKRSAKSESGKKKSSARESEKQSHRKKISERAERDRKHDRQSKRMHVVPDETESEAEIKDNPPRRYDSARETSREYTRKGKSSESDESTDDVKRKAEAAARYMGRSDQKLENRNRPASLKTPYPSVRMESAPINVRRSSARSPLKESSRKEAEKTRQYSDPNIYRTDVKADFDTGIFNRDGRPAMEKRNNSTTADHISMERDRRYRTTSSTKPVPKESPSLKRHETDPTAHSRRPERHERPELPRGQSSLRREFNHGIPTPPLSPPRDAYKPSRKYVIEEDHTREVSPGTKPRRTRSPSPLPDRERERERKSRTTSSRHAREAPEVPAVPFNIRTTGLDGMYADRMTESPVARSARPMTSAHDYFSPQKEEPLLFNEIPTPSSRRHSPRDQAVPPDTVYIEQQMYPRESTKVRRSSKSTSRPKVSRSHSHAYGSGQRRGIFAA